ncbi:unnamed protein product [Clonostachys rosea]|uniref:RelA/SpoT domain-containing protein n=1 Tax=Bionectria ochroleuca TaxID=29856 RepID=A0ABY6U7K2_BIOOC|nr:unnamed protein product [Clonostachys rosea]
MSSDDDAGFYARCFSCCFGGGRDEANRHQRPHQHSQPGSENEIDSQTPLLGPDNSTRASNYHGIAAAENPEVSTERSCSPLGLHDKLVHEFQHVSAHQPADEAFFDIWKKMKPHYEVMRRELERLLQHRLDDIPIRATISSRVKLNHSIEQSIHRRAEFGNKTYENPEQIFKDVHDLLGFRIVVDYPSGLEKSYAFLDQTFSIQKVNEFFPDREVGREWKPRFGAYHAKNYLVQMKTDLSNTELHTYNGVLFEIQVVSLGESLYNRLAHSLLYKRKGGNLSRQDEMVLDMSHGLALCYCISIAYMEDKLEDDSQGIQQRPDIPEAARMLALDNQDQKQYMIELTKLTPNIPNISEEHLPGSSRDGSTQARPDTDALFVKFLKSIGNISHDLRPQAEVWNEIREKLGLDDGAYKELLSSLKYEDMNKRKNQILYRHEETFEWIYWSDKNESLSFKHHANKVVVERAYSGNREGEDTLSTQKHRFSHYDFLRYENRIPWKKSKMNHSFIKWLREDRDQTYWVSGKPGSGKSILMKFIETDKRTREALQYWRSGCYIISHFLWKAGSKNQHSFTGLLCSLLHQVLWEETEAAMQLLRNRELKAKSYTTDWSVESLRKLLLYVLRHTTSSYLILLDGIDELSEPPEVIDEFFGFLKDLVALHQVKLCVSSRPERHFASKFGDCPQLQMQDLTSQDIEKYTVDQLCKLQANLDDESLSEIITIILEKAEGVFIWVYVVLADIRTLRKEYEESWDHILKHIDKLPKNLVQLYKSMWERLDNPDEMYVQKAARYFQWLKKIRHFEYDIEHFDVRKHEPSIAMLAIIANDEALESFITPDRVPYIDKWIELCQKTLNTLFQISGGLLEVTRTKGYFSDNGRISENVRKIVPWATTYVGFMHRTAVDFLESNEGKILFEKHELSDEEFLSVAVKAYLIFESCIPISDIPLRKIWNLIFKGKRGRKWDELAPMDHKLLLLTHRCAIDKQREILRPPPDMSYENHFLAQASGFGIYEFLEGFVDALDANKQESWVYLLIGAIKTKDGLYSFNTSWESRYPFIRDILRHHISPAIGITESPALSASADIMRAWRCFLTHEVSLQGSRAETVRAVNNTNAIIEEILELFIRLGVMVTAPNYLISRQHHEFRIPKIEKIRRLHENTTVYVEANDALLLQRLLMKTGGTSAFLRSKAQDAFAKPILGFDLYMSTQFFELEVKDNSQEEFIKWFFSEEEFSDNLFHGYKPKFLRQNGLFGRNYQDDDTLSNLKRINYNLSEANQAYECLHSQLEAHSRRDIS